MEKAVNTVPCFKYSSKIIDCCDALHDVGDTVSLLSDLTTIAANSPRSEKEYLRQMEDVINRIDKVTGELTKLLL